MLGQSYSAPQTARVVWLKGANRSVIYLMVIAAAFYFPWRITTFNPDALILSLVLYGAEVFGLVTILLHAFMTWRMIERDGRCRTRRSTWSSRHTTNRSRCCGGRCWPPATCTIRTRHGCSTTGAVLKWRLSPEELGVHYLSRAERVRLGVDATFQGDKSYKQFSAGANLTLTINSIHSFGLRAGASTNGSDTGLYGGISFVFTRN